MYRHGVIAVSMVKVYQVIWRLSDLFYSKRDFLWLCAPHNSLARHGPTPPRGDPPFCARRGAATITLFYTNKSAPNPFHSKSYDNFKTKPHPLYFSTTIVRPHPLDPENTPLRSPKNEKPGAYLSPRLLLNRKSLTNEK